MVVLENKHPSANIICCQPKWTHIDEIEPPTGDEIVFKGWVIPNDFTIDFNGADIPDVSYGGKSYEFLRLLHKNETHWIPSSSVKATGDDVDVAFDNRCKDPGEPALDLLGWLSWDKENETMKLEYYVDGTTPSTGTVLTFTFDFTGSSATETDPSLVLNFTATDASGVLASFSGQNISHNSGLNYGVRPSPPALAVGYADVWSGAHPSAYKLLTGQWINNEGRSYMVKIGSTELYPSGTAAYYALAPSHNGTDKVGVTVVLWDTGEDEMIWRAEYEFDTSWDDWPADAEGFVIANNDAIFIEYSYRNSDWWDGSVWIQTPDHYAPGSVTIYLDKSDPSDINNVEAFPVTPKGYRGEDPVFWDILCDGVEYGGGTFEADDGTEWTARFELRQNLKGFGHDGDAPWQSRYIDVSGNVIGWLDLRDSNGNVRILPLYIRTFFTSNTASAFIMASYIEEGGLQTTITVFRGESVPSAPFTSVDITNEISEAGGEGYVYIEPDEYTPEEEYIALDVGFNGTITLSP
ncbi:hypothetical protein P0Y35_08765 [Kiritimatiellaeota bacterium B1221]|nr:hypothetical protein [Kiritimatiellaeota bacterium B1221]